MRGLAIFKFIIWGIILVFLCGILFSAVFHVGFWDTFRIGMVPWDKNGSLKVVGEYSLSGDSISQIAIDWKSGKVRLFPSDNGNIRITEYAREDLDQDRKLKYDVKGEILSIRQGDRLKSMFFWIFQDVSTHVDVYLPQKMYDKIDVGCTSGQIEVKNISASDFAAYATSGKMILSDIEAQRSSLGTTSGSIAGTAVKLGEVKCSATSGNIDLKGTLTNIDITCVSGNTVIDTDIRPDRLTANATSGSLIVRLPENDGFTVLYTVTSGSFQSDFEMPILKSNPKSGTATYKDGGPGYSLNVVSGRLELRRR